MPDRPREREDLERTPDPEPWENRRPPERPRHESAAPDDPDDPTERTEAIAAAGYGEGIERPSGETVDGDFNGAPELEGLEQTSAWEGTDVLEAMEGREVASLREADVADDDEVLADLVAERRQLLVDRYDEARELGLEAVIDAALAASEPSAPGTPVVVDEDVLRDQLARIDTAIDELERHSAERRP